MASRRGSGRRKATRADGPICRYLWLITDEGTNQLVGARPCYGWKCEVCGPKREAEAMEMLRLRFEGWQEDPEASPNFITLTADRSKLPPFIEVGGDEEDGYLRACFGNVMRQLNQEERRKNRGRIEYVGVVERGGKTGNWHLHLVTSREVHVNRWRRVCEARGLGRVVKAKRLKGAKGAAIYLAKYLRKGSTAHGKGRRVLLHTRGCLPSLELWRWRRSMKKGFRNASSWTPEALKVQREYMRSEKDELRREMEASAKGPLRLWGTVRTRKGGQVVVTRALRPKFCTAIRRPPETTIRSGHGEAATAREEGTKPDGE
jgi:hypothetical protein